MIRRVSAGLLALALSSGCDTVRPNDQPTPGSTDSLDIALFNAVHDHIVPAVRSFHGESLSFAAEANAFCDAPDTDGLAALQARWRHMTLVWNGVIPFNLGPLNDDLIFPKVNFIESMRQRGTDYTETVRGTIEEALADDAPLDPAFFDRLTFNKVGLLALEVLVFESTQGEHPQDADAIVADYAAQPRKCIYLRGITAQLIAQADYVERGWTAAFLDTGEPFGDRLIRGELEDGAQPVPALITTVQEHIDYLKRRKLDGILDARLSDQFYANIAAGLDAIEVVLEGVKPTDHGLIDHMIGAEHPDEVALVRANLATARAAIEAEDREALSAALAALDGNFKREIPESLNVVLGINFSDGD